MSLFSNFFRSAGAPRPVLGAMNIEQHWVHPKLSWEESARAFAALFPRETRMDRPASWYEAVCDTHWPGKIPPGNGPFYIPEWLLDLAAEQQSLADGNGGRGPDECLKQITELLTKSGFRQTESHSVKLPENASYLVTAMRVAGENPWNVDPTLFRAYVYPTLPGGGKKAVLRAYNTTLWSV